jgi:hypothetical protein
MKFPPIQIRKKGRKPNDPVKLWKRETEELAADMAFAEAMETLHDSTGLAFGPRGWAYYAEGQNPITKGEFGPFEACIARLRKDGLLNPDVVPDDKSRETLCVESVDDETPERFAVGWLNFVTSHMSRYAPISIWEGLDYYVEVAVEKKDLLQIYQPICKPLGIPLSNLKGWSDVNTRRHMLKRMRDNYNEGRLPILLYIGDFDPNGLLISDALKSNLMDCENIQDVQWDAEPVKVIRVGLTRQQIDSLNLVWIDNLETSGTDANNKARDLADAKHPDHFKSYVQDYLAAHGPRKVEANALVADVPAARQILRDAIAEFVPDDWAETHHQRLEESREQAREAFASLLRNQGGE